MPSEACRPISPAQPFLGHGRDSLQRYHGSIPAEADAALGIPPAPQYELPTSTTEAQNQIKSNAGHTARSKTFFLGIQKSYVDNNGHVPVTSKAKPRKRDVDPLQQMMRRLRLEKYLPQDAGSNARPTMNLPAKRGSGTRRVKALFKSLSSNSRRNEDRFEKSGYVFLENSNERVDTLREAMIIFDIACPLDLISSSFTKDALGVNLYSKTAKTRKINEDCNGRDIRSIGTLQALWLAGGMMRYRQTDFNIVNSDRFDVIIGIETISRLGLFGPKGGIIAAFTKIKSSLTHASGGAATRESLSKASDPQPPPTPSETDNEEPHISSAISECSTPTASEYSSYTEDSEELSGGHNSSIIDTIPVVRAASPSFWSRQSPSTGNTYLSGRLNEGGPSNCTEDPVKHGADSTCRLEPRFKEPTKFKSRKHRLHVDDDDKDDNNEAERHSTGSRKRRRKEDLSDPHVAARLLACPFAKYHPMRHISCCSEGFTSPHYLKQHLRSKHLVPVHCPTCGDTFEGSKRNSNRDQHIKLAKCSLKDLSGRWHGLNADQQTWISKRKPAGISDREYWMNAYGEFFDGPLPEHPYHEDIISLALPQIQQFVSDAMSKSIALSSFQPALANAFNAFSTSVRQANSTLQLASSTSQLASELHMAATTSDPDLIQTPLPATPLSTRDATPVNPSVDVGGNPTPHENCIIAPTDIPSIFSPPATSDPTTAVPNDIFASLVSDPGILSQFEMAFGDPLSQHLESNFDFTMPYMEWPFASEAGDPSNAAEYDCTTQDQADDGNGVDMGISAPGPAPRYEPGQSPADTDVLDEPRET